MRLRFSAFCFHFSRSRAMGELIRKSDRAYSNSTEFLLGEEAPARETFGAGESKSNAQQFTHTFERGCIGVLK